MAEDALEEAERYLQPVIKREDFVLAKGVSVVDRLHEVSNQGIENEWTRQDAVVDKALSLLEAIHQSVSSDQASATRVSNTSSSRRLIDALLDLISLEGIYPHLLPGVGSPIERRVRSVLQGGITITDVRRDQKVRSGHLESIIERLYNLIIFDNGVAAAIQQRTLVDVIAAIAQLAYGPGQTSVGQWSGKLSQLIDSQSPTILFPSLISLLHATTPDWLKPNITTPLSLLPMRTNGVRQTITFVAKSTPQRPTQNLDKSGDSHQGPTLSVEVLAQVAKLLSAVPSSVSAEAYFNNIGPQLLQLLDDRDPDAKRAAAYTISHGILSKRRLGQPGGIGWLCFAEPLLVVMNPTLSPKTSPVRSSSQLTYVLKVLSTLILTFVNPALSRRLLNPVILSIWAIVCLSTRNSTKHDLAKKMLEHYIDSVAGSKGLLAIADMLMYNGDTEWMFSGGATQAISIITRTTKSSKQEKVYEIGLVQSRVDQLMQLVDACRDDTEVGSFFAGILQRALKRTNSEFEPESKDDLQPVIYASIARELLSAKISRLMHNISSIVAVFEEVLSSNLTTLRIAESSQKMPVSRLSVSNIVSNQNEEESLTSLQELENNLSICLPWLVLAVQTDAESDPGMASHQFKSLQHLLGTILSTTKISRASKEAIRSVLRLIDSAGSSTGAPNASHVNEDRQDLELHTKAMKNLQAVEPPIRVQGLSQLEQLVSHGSLLVSTASAILTVLSLLQDPDSFVYLSAINSLVRLTRKEPQLSFKILQEAYQDITEQSTVDVRLRVGEALQTIIEEIEPQQSSPAFDRLMRMLLFISSRRVYRAKTHEAQYKSSVLPRVVAADKDESEIDSEDEGREPEQDLQAVLDSWQGKAGAEDLRIRASALTIIGAAFEHADLSSMISFVQPSLEIIVQILEKEKGQENAILRRAAVLVVLSMIQSQANTRNDTTSLLTAGITDGQLSMDAISAILESVAVEDDDEMVRGHAENVLKTMQEWRQETFDTLVRGDEVRFGLEDKMGNVRLRGLDIDPTPKSDTGPDKRLKIEEID